MSNETPAKVLQIVEVIGPAEQGKSLPFKCIAEDGYLYYVKGQQTNRASLWSEWICAHLATEFGLSIPPFSLVQLDEVLLAELPGDWQSIGGLPAFGSREHPGMNWLELGMADQVPPAVQRDVLVFDWWVYNADRLKGNPNLLWDAEKAALVVIDHNLAFEPDFDPRAFLSNHLFAAQWPELVEDLVTRAEYAQRLHELLPCASSAMEVAPAEWLWENSEFDVPANFDRARAMRVLSRCATPELWRSV